MEEVTLEQLQRELGPAIEYELEELGIHYMSDAYTLYKDGDDVYVELNGVRVKANI